jgi:hypothetical protein
MDDLYCQRVGLSSTGEPWARPISATARAAIARRRRLVTLLVLDAASACPEPRPAPGARSSPERVPAVGRLMRANSQPVVRDA